MQSENLKSFYLKGYTEGVPNSFTVDYNKGSCVSLHEHKMLNFVIMCEVCINVIGMYLLYYYN